ncbi:hypothetical protein ACLOJK_006784, partial [Asimina triloba]
QSVVSTLPEIEADADTVLYLLILSPMELLVLATGCYEVAQLVRPQGLNFSKSV